jgi:hypothetical protein
LNTLEIINKLENKYIWDEMPVYSFTTDIDWASEDILSLFFKKINNFNIRLDAFITHDSDIINLNELKGNLIKHPHPNFCLPSSHGKSEDEIIEYILKLVPNSLGLRMHRFGTNSGIEHKFKEKFGYKYISNCINLLQKNIRPFVLESGMVSLPIFFEDGTHLYQKMNLDFKNYESKFRSNGLKIISFHPIDFVLNSDSYEFMRKVRDSVSRNEYNNMSKETINKVKNDSKGIRDFIYQILEFVENNNLKIMTLDEIYGEIIRK